MRTYEADWVTEIRKKASASINSLPLPRGEFIDIMKFIKSPKEIPKIEKIEDAPKEVLDLFEKMGISEEERKMFFGLSVQANDNVIYKKVRDELAKKQIIIEAMDVALKKYDWLKEYFFNLVKYDENKLTAYHAANWKNGVFVWAKGKYDLPIHAYFMLLSPLYSQMEHTVVIAEPHSKIFLVEGCTAPLFIRESVHIGINEIYIKDNAELTLTKLQNWPKHVHTRPISKIVLGNNSKLHLINVIYGGGASTVEYPEIEIRGDNSKVSVESIVFTKSSKVKLGATVYVRGKQSSVVLPSKAIASEASSILIEDEIKAFSKCKGHISCDGILLDDKSEIESVPALFTKHKDAELSHEASIGRLNEEALFYLMSRGLDEETARAVLIKGFVEPVLKHLPFQYRIEINKLLEIAAQGSM
ncbi:Fe-S cluster assembly protein SufB [Candidatus Micrarchaeota archaeon]|nr:MAG: Fe-S cluster assembly protein SufB [Candidatus Micrarchaeota archaeon]